MKGMFYEKIDKECLWAAQEINPRERNLTVKGKDYKKSAKPVGYYDKQILDEGTSHRELR